ncbi:hypothetical protein ACFX15_014004 [Malus domestica]
MAKVVALCDDNGVSRGLVCVSTFQEAAKALSNLLVTSYKCVIGCTYLIQGFGKARRFGDRGDTMFTSMFFHAFKLATLLREGLGDNDALKDDNTFFNVTTKAPTLLPILPLLLDLPLKPSADSREATCFKVEDFILKEVPVLRTINKSRFLRAVKPPEISGDGHFFLAKDLGFEEVTCFTKKFFSLGPIKPFFEETFGSSGDGETSCFMVLGAALTWGFCSL